MIYLVSKIVISLLAALGLGFGMAWMLQMHLAARLREQLNSVIFETKSRIPALESEITNRDQEIDGLREKLAQKPKAAEPNKNQQSNKEQEKQIDELRQKVMDLENELTAAKATGQEETFFEIDEADRAKPEETELMSDDEFLTDIQDIFEDADDSMEVFGSDSTDAAPAQSPEDSAADLEAELQNELEGWDQPEEQSATDLPDGVIPIDKKVESKEHTVALPPAEDPDGKKPPGRAGRVDLKAELLGLEEEFREGDEEAKPLDLNDLESMRGEIENLTQARKSLNEVVDSQAKEMTSLQNQRDLQDKSLNVLNQQLELARMANERILRELRELKDSKPSSPDKPRSATGS